MAKQRSANFSKDENQLLIDIARNHPIIESASKLKSVADSKVKAWKTIYEEFVASNISGLPRTQEQLEVRYKRMSVEARKKNDANKRYMRGTGGGPPAPDLSEDDKILIGLQTDNYDPIDNLLDDDCYEVFTPPDSILIECINTAENKSWMSSSIETPNCSSSNSSDGERIISVSKSNGYFKKSVKASNKRKRQVMPPPINDEATIVALAKAEQELNQELHEKKATLVAKKLAVAEEELRLAKSRAELLNLQKEEAELNKKKKQLETIEIRLRLLKVLKEYKDLGIQVPENIQNLIEIDEK